MKWFMRLLLSLGCLGTPAALAADPNMEPVNNWVEAALPQLLEDYRWLHTHPEVSFQEAETAKYVAKQWRDAGFTVTEKVGGHGVVAILKNGEGPTVMLRTDLDGLPVSEQTGLPFASKQTVLTEAGTSSGVMHACGHEYALSSVIGAARYLASHKSDWSGTLMLIGQPAEERGSGAKAMLERWTVQALCQA